MKNLLVYLHGFDSCNSENKKFQLALADNMDAYLLSPQTKLESGLGNGGFAWYPIKKCNRHMTHNPYFWFNQGLVITEIYENLSKNNLDWKDVIFFGCDQGAFTALNMALDSTKIRQKTKGVIAFNGFYFNSEKTESKKPKLRNDVPVLFANTEKGCLLKNNGHKVLSKNGLTPEVMTIPNSKDNILSLKDIPVIMAKLKQIGIQY